MSFLRSSDRRRRGSRAQENIIDEEQRYAKFQEQYSNIDKAEKDRKSSREVRADLNVRGQLKDFDDHKKYAKFEDEYTRFEKSERERQKSRSTVPEKYQGQDRNQIREDYSRRHPKGPAVSSGSKYAQAPYDHALHQPQTGSIWARQYGEPNYRSTDNARSSTQYLWP